MANTLRVEYYGTNVGKIYFTDIDRRGQLGGADEAQYVGGQDQYIVWGETKVLQITDDVLYSMAEGVLKFYSTQSSSSVFDHNGPPLTLTEGSYTKADEDPRQDLGDTGRFADSYMQDVLAYAKYEGSSTAGETGYYYGNQDL